MNREEICQGYFDENYLSYLVEYRGDIKSELEKIDFACGDVITENLAVISTPIERLDEVRSLVPSITFIEASGVYVLQDITPSNIQSINSIKKNPYLNLNGRGVIVGVIDTGINYLNREFMREDDTTRIIRLWDQTIQPTVKGNLYLGTEYTEGEINNAIELSLKGEDPYSIVPSKDEIGHGTKMASIIGARGYNKEVEGIATDCDFCVVKLFQSPYLKRILRENRIPEVPIFNNTEVLTAIDYIKNVGEELKRPVVIYIGVGSQEGSHDGYNITSSYLTNLSSRPGFIVVTGTGNSGNDEGHFLGFIKNVNESMAVELTIPRELKRFELYIWVQKPNRMNLNIISPQGENSGIFKANIFSIDERIFYLSDTRVRVRVKDPENFTGHQLFTLEFDSIKPGIWQFILIGTFITNGRFDIWLPSKVLLPEGTKFLKSTPENTLTIPSTALNIITTSFYDGTTGGILGESGKGFNTNLMVKPDISAIGTNVLTTSVDGNSVTTASGSSVATAIVAGGCALFVQWGIIDGNDKTIYSAKLRSLLIYAARRESVFDYPNIDIGYGKFDLKNVFNVIGGNFNNIRNRSIGEIKFSIPSNMERGAYRYEKWEVMNCGD